jgi:RNA polymerase sigma-70 factor (ECF subfamily)
VLQSALLSDSFFLRLLGFLSSLGGGIFFVTREYVERLWSVYRAVLVLHDRQGLKNREIAEVLDCSLSTVKIRLHRGRNKLRTALKAGCDFVHDERNVFVCEP